MRKLLVMIATGFGLGYSPVASGTVGSLLGIPLAFFTGMLSLPLQIVICIGLVFLCIPICTVAEEVLGRKDDGRIVADEYMTFPICLIGLPWTENLWILLSSFLVCRFMDILKPFPAYRLQSLPRGLGIVMDDAIASLYALAINWLAVRYLLPVVM